jgi:predicted HicB family RNase H-like nuclease
MGTSSVTEAQRKRLQTMVAVEVHREVKIAAAIEGQTIEEWLAVAIDERLAKKRRAELEVIKP